MVSVDTRYLVFGGSFVGRSSGRVRVSVTSPRSATERSEQGVLGASLSREIPAQTTSRVLRGLGNRTGCDTCPEALGTNSSRPLTTTLSGALKGRVPPSPQPPPAPRRRPIQPVLGLPSHTPPWPVHRTRRRRPPGQPPRQRWLPTPPHPSLPASTARSPRARPVRTQRDLISPPPQTPQPPQRVAWPPSGAPR